jgi:hypothetical protein
MSPALFRIRLLASLLMGAMGAAFDQLVRGATRCRDTLRSFSDTSFPYEWGRIGAAALQAVNHLGMEAEVVVFPRERRVRILVSGSDWGHVKTLGEGLLGGIARELGAPVLRRVHFEVAESTTDPIWTGPCLRP